MAQRLEPSDGIYRNTLLRISDLAVTSDLLEGLTFENCQIVGPAVLGVLNNNTFVNCNWEGPPEAIIWEVPEDRPVLGVIGLQTCTFAGCHFQRISMAMNSPMAQLFREGISRAP